MSTWPTARVNATMWAFVQPMKAAACCRETTMSQQDQATLYPASDAFRAAAEIGPDDYQRLYRQSLDEPEAFWATVAERLDWFTRPTAIKDVSYRVEDFRIRWYADGELNVAVNCVDRHLATRADKTAIIWEGDDPGEARHISYRELHAEVCRLANARWCSAVFRPMPWPGGWPTARASWSSPPMKACAAARWCRSRPTSTKP
jgi:hypothetical protein